MRRNTIDVGGTCLTLVGKTLIVTRPEYMLMLCTECGQRKSSFTIDANLDKEMRKYLTSELDQLVKCKCLEAQNGTDCHK